MTAHGNGNGSNGLYGAHGRSLVVDLSTGEHHTETIPADVFRQYLGGYGLGAWLMWKQLSRRRAEQLGMAELLDAQLA